MGETTADGMRGRLLKDGPGKEGNEVYTYTFIL